MTDAAVLQHALALHEAGRIAEAVALYRDILARDPANADALHLLGVAARQAGKPADSVRLIDLALRRNATAPLYHYNRALALQDLGRTAEAAVGYQRMLALGGPHPDALYNLGCALLGLAQWDAAAARFRELIALVPGHGEGRANLAAAAIATGDHAAGQRLYRETLALAPDDTGVLGNLAASLEHTGRVAEAVAVAGRVVRAAPPAAAGWLRLGTALVAARRMEAAAAAYRRAVALAPDRADTWSNLSVAFNRLGHLVAAADAAARAVARDPRSADLHVQRANVLLSLVEHGAAGRAYTRALAVAPDHPLALANRLYALSYHPTLPAGGVFRYFVDWGARLAPLAATAAPFANRPDPGRRLRVGFVSPDFRRHSSRIHFLPLFERLDRDRVELTAYANVGAPDDYTERFRAVFDRWRDVRGVRDAVVAEQVKDDGIDVLIDATGHMEDHRLGVFARRAAPVQATWLGTVWTTGLACMDWAIQDPHMAPPGSDSLFTERVWRLPHTLFAHRPNEAAPAVAPLPAGDGRPLTFGYFGRTERLNERVFALWAALHRRLPEAVIDLDFRHFNNAATRAHVARRLAGAGLDMRRVRLGFTTPVWPALARVDVMLDSFPHSGGTMLFDALWAGVPVLTLADRPPVGRIGTMAMRVLGLDDWACGSPDAVLERAVAADRDRDGLAALRAGLRARMAASPLCDEAAFAAAFLEAVRGMWRDWCAQRADGAGALANGRTAP